jgi:SCY1-like protein 1
MGNQSDTGWAGWAISSFTNKMAAAKGEIASTTTTNGSALTQTQSLPASGRATPTVTVIPDRSATAVSRPQIPQTARSSTSQPPEPDVVFEDDNMDAWGTMDDDGDNFFEAAPIPAKPLSPMPAVAATFNDGGEPDFAGWLAAQSKAKGQKPLPKGIGKTSVGAAGNTLNVRPGVPGRSASAGPGTSTSTAKKAVVATRTVPVLKKEVQKNASSLKPKESDANDDDWGDAWD